MFLRSIWQPRLDLLTRRASQVAHQANQDTFDIAIVGGGIVGLATAREMMLRWPNRRFVVVEKETSLAVHQSGHNSGVIHAGIYYTPGSLKAKLCVEGLKRSYAYCDAKGIPYKKCGKLIVATNLAEKERLSGLFERGLQNGVPELRLLTSKEEILEVEPQCTGGIAAIHSPVTGIVDWQRVSRSYGSDFQAAGGTVITNFEVNNITSSADSAHPVTLSPLGSSHRAIRCSYAVTCGGLFSDRLAQLSGCSSDPRIVPFRGDYLMLPAEKAGIVRGNIYPLPDPRFPFLGVHFTPRMDGTVWLGPNAVLALKREGYGLFDFSLKDMRDALGHPGLRRLAWRYIGKGLEELYGAINIRRQVSLLQRFCPSLRVEDVRRGPSGVRAQALDPKGNLVDDFVFDRGNDELSARVLHVRNAPSPAATSSLAIARLVADRCGEQFGLGPFEPTSP